MQQSTNNLEEDINSNIDELLEHWEKIRNISKPLNENASEAIVREYAKNIIDRYAHKLRVSRLENNQQDEIYYMGKFSENYKKYDRDLTYRILKNAK